MLLPMTAEIRAEVGIWAYNLWQMLWSGGLFALVVLVGLIVLLLILRKILETFIYGEIEFYGWGPILFIGTTSGIGAVFYYLTPWGFYLGETFLKAFNELFG